MDWAVLLAHVNRLERVHYQQTGETVLETWMKLPADQQRRLLAFGLRRLLSRLEG